MARRLCLLACEMQASHASKVVGQGSAQPLLTCRTPRRVAPTSSFSPASQQAAHRACQGQAPSLHHRPGTSRTSSTAACTSSSASSSAVARACCCASGRPHTSRRTPAQDPSGGTCRVHTAAQQAWGARRGQPTGCCECCSSKPLPAWTAAPATLNAHHSCRAAADRTSAVPVVDARSIRVGWQQ